MKIMFKKIYAAACMLFLVLLVGFYGRIMSDANFKGFMILFAIALLVTIPIKRYKPVK